MEQNENNYQIDLKRIFTILLANWLVIAIVALIFGAGAFAYTKFYVAPVYASNVSMYVNNYKSTNGAEPIKTNYTDINAAQMLVKTYTAITTSNSVIGDVVKTLEKEEHLKSSIDEIKKMISVQIVEDTEIFQITVLSTNPEHAYKVAKVIGKVVPEKIPNFIESSSVKILDKPIKPTAPISPNIKKNTIIGVLFGMILSMAFVFLRDFFDLRVKTAEDLTNLFSLPVLGNIPEITAEELLENE